MSVTEPAMSFSIEDGIVYAPELRCQVADCMRRANEDFINYSIAKLQRDGTIERDWPVHISVNIQRDAVSWSLVSRSGHRFSASYPDHRAGSA